jgi:hypothetical protein
MIKFYEVIEERVVGLGRIVHTASESYEDWTINEQSLGLYTNKEVAEYAKKMYEIWAARSSNKEEKKFKIREVQVKD